MKNLVFDTTVLSHFARAEALDSLQKLASDFRCLTPSQVHQELVSGIGEYPVLSAAISLSWVTVVDPTGIDELVAFAQYRQEFAGTSNRHNGEAAVLALVAVNGGIALIDERVATHAGRRDGLTVQGSVWLVVEGCRRGKVVRSEAEQLIDDLGATGMRLPMDGAGLFAWAYKEGLLP